MQQHLEIHYVCKLINLIAKYLVFTVESQKLVSAFNTDCIITFMQLDTGVE